MVDAEWVGLATDSEKAETRELLGIIVDAWMDELRGKDSETAKNIIDDYRDDLSPLRSNDPARRLPVLREQAAAARKHAAERALFQPIYDAANRTYSLACDILDGKVSRDAVSDEGRKLLEEVQRLQQEVVPKLDDKGKQFDAGRLLSEALLEANFIWRAGKGGDILSMRLGRRQNR
jgi:hypothetical protein